MVPDLTGIVLHDRSQNYGKFPGITHQLRTAHLLRDIEDAVQSYPTVIWPGQTTSALRPLIHAANLARDQGLAAVPEDAKTQQKISGRLRSEQATRHRYAVRGYLSTAAKHGINVYTALRGALAGNPWMPPIPADA